MILECTKYHLLYSNKTNNRTKKLILMNILHDVPDKTANKTAYNWQHGRVFLLKTKNFFM